MIKEDYCSYEISKLLKEKGFDESIHTWYNTDDGSPEFIEGYIKMSNADFAANDEDSCSAPTHQLACAWLRGKGYHIYVDYNTKYNCWHRHIQETSTGIVWSLGGLKSHDDAIENAIKYALEVLI